jgi:sugar phosphate isomerase/epimerase
MNLVSLFSQSLFALDLERAIEVTATAGYAAIEIACCKPHLDLVLARDPATGLASRTATQIQSAGLLTSALSGFVTLTDPQILEHELEEVETLIRLAPGFGTDLVKLTPGPPASAEAASEHWRCLEEALASIVPLARQAGVRLAFETHMRQLSDTLASSARLLSLAPSDVVGLTVDYSNLAFAGDDLAEVVRELGDRTYNTHLKNGTIDAEGSWHFGPLDQGWTDYRLVLNLLHERGYDGPLAIECLGPDAARQPTHTVRRDREILVHYLSEVGWTRAPSEDSSCSQQLRFGNRASHKKPSSRRESDEQ